MRWTPLLILLLFCSACTTANPWVEIKGRHFEVEIADTLEQQAQGLMFRDTMPADHGMLFIFPSEAPRSFWMRNTRIPLDIFYFDAQFSLVSVAENARPCRASSCPGYPSEGAAQYVLELNAGLASELGVRPGDRLTVHLD
jgi:uncharacterized membrane protein (UPF0127 family)